VPPSAIGHAPNLEVPEVVSAIGVVCGRKRAQGGKVALGVTLPDVDGQIRDGAGVLFVEAQRARAEGPIRSHERLVDRFLDSRPDASGRQLRQA
jgi:hypothetical protein